jgi:hypothetical protein
MGRNSRKITEPQVVLQAADESGSDTPTPAAADKRKKVSERLYIDASGTEVDNIQSATGARYVLLDPAGNHQFDEQLGEAGKFATMAAIFGMHTKLGNVANSELNADEPGTPADAAVAIREFITAAKTGTWAERTGGVAVRIDKDKLAGAIVTVAQASGKTADYQKIRDKLESDPAYVRAARQVSAVADAYAAAVGKAAKSVDDLLAI